MCGYTRSPYFMFISTNATITFFRAFAKESAGYYPKEILARFLAIGRR